MSNQHSSNASTKPALPLASDPLPKKTNVAAATANRSDKNSLRPTWRFLCAHPAHFIALGFASGLPSTAPGTFGTLAAWGLFVALDLWLNTSGWFVLISLALAVGTWAAGRTGQALGRADAGQIVIDEIVAFWLVLVMLPTGSSWHWQLAAFALFRLFDITKPPPIGWLDTHIKGGWGVMLDDLVAAFYALLVLSLWVRLT